MNAIAQGDHDLRGGETRHGRFLLGGMYRAVLAAIGDLGSDSVILDVGCGAGWLLSQAHKRWPAAKLIGADPSEKALAAARELVPHATLHLAVAQSLPLPDESVDAVVSTLSLHHWGDREAGLREVRRVLRPGGLLVVGDFTLPNWTRWLARRHRPASRREVPTLLDAAGIPAVEQRAMYLGFVTVTVGRRSG